MTINTRDNTSTDRIRNAGKPYCISSLLLFSLSFPLSMVCVHLLTDGPHDALRGILVVVVDTIYFWILILVLGVITGLIGYFLSTRRLLTLTPFLLNAFMAVFLVALLSISSDTAPDKNGIVTTLDTEDSNGGLNASRDESLAPINKTSIATATNVNDWGSGFHVQHHCLVPSGIDTVEHFEIDINYSGSGKITNSWMQGYNGGINTGLVASDGGYGITSNSYVPPLSGGDQITFIVQVQGVGYTASDFEVQCAMAGR